MTQKLFIFSDCLIFKAQKLVPFWWEIELTRKNIFKSNSKYLKMNKTFKRQNPSIKINQN